LLIRCPGIGDGQKSTNQDLSKKEESIKSQPATAELENLPDELSREDAVKVAGGVKGIGEQ